MAKEKKTSLVKQFFVNLLLGANLFTLVLLWVCCATTWIDPSLHPSVSMVGLGFPVFIILNLIFIPLWLLFQARMVIVPIVGMALCGSYILDYCPLHFDSSDESDITVMTWNCHDMQLYQPDSIEYATGYIAESGADIICLQEYNFNDGKYKALNETMLEKGYHLEHKTGGLAIMSRFPILSCEVIDMESVTTNGAFLADVQLPDGDTLSVFCVHLECIHLSLDDKNEYGASLRSGESERMKDEAHYLQGKLSDAAKVRALQVNELVERLDSLPQSRSVLVCGDFNDTPISYAYQHVARRLQNAYRQGGQGIGLSFRERLFPVRIDHIFHTKDYTCTSARVDNSISASDHYPVIATLQKCEK